jgi:hypothetical protein
MYSIRVATTDDREAPPAEDWPGLSWDRLCDVLRVEVSPEAAALLAEPIADPARGLTHWHIVALEDPRPLHALSPGEREQLLARFKTLRDKIRAYADRLAAAGGESNLRLAIGLRSAVDLDAGVAQLWSSGGAPLLTGWGRRRARGGGETATIVGGAANPLRGDAPLRGKSFIPGLTWTGRLPPGASLPGRLARLRLGWLAWLPFCLLVAAIFYKLLPACAIDLPGLRAINYCEAPRDAALDTLQNRNAELRRLLNDSEKGLAEICAKPARESATPAAPPSRDETRRRVDDAQLRHGPFEVTLAWEGRQDLDLYIYCPGGKLYHGAPRACGGALDHDANRVQESAVDHPLEHAVWEQDPPPGLYRIVVNAYDHGLPPRQVAFTVVVKSDGAEKTYTGVARAYGEDVEVARVTR